MLECCSIEEKRSKRRTIRLNDFLLSSLCDKGALPISQLSPCSFTDLDSYEYSIESRLPWSPFFTQVLAFDSSFQIVPHVFPPTQVSPL
jgi:hypothetical protein